MSKHENKAQGKQRMRTFRIKCIVGVVIYAILFCTNIVISQPRGIIMKQEKGSTRSLVPDIGITDKDRQLSSNILNKILAGEFVLLVQTLNYHWNLVGPEFHDYHLLFDGQYKAIFEKIDEIAERVRAVGGIALGSMADMIKEALLKEDVGGVPSPRTMVENLLGQHELLIKEIRGGINKTSENNRDMGTSNFLSELIEKHEKFAWMLRSLLQ
jgi:starvation-inducible DNA-binding protein